MLPTYMQREPSEHAEQSNRLPTPNGPFRPILRMYAPYHEILNGEYLSPRSQNDLSRFVCRGLQPARAPAGDGRHPDR